VKSNVDQDWIDIMKQVAVVSESTAWSKIKIPTAVKKSFTTEKPGKMKIEVK